MGTRDVLVVNGWRTCLHASFVAFVPNLESRDMPPDDETASPNYIFTLWRDLAHVVLWKKSRGRLAQYHRAKALPSWATSVHASSKTRERIDISVVIPCFNYADYLEAAVNSVLAAATRARGLGVEILIIDDCSSDRSHDVAMSLLESAAIPIRIVRPWWNVGLSKARNLGLRHARGEFVFLLDADNTLTPTALADLHARAIAEASDAVYGPLRIVTPDSVHTGWLSERPFDLDSLKLGNYIDAMALFRRATLVTLGGYDLDLLRVVGGWEDYDVWLRFAKSGLKVSFAPDVVIGDYLAKPDSMVNRISLKERFDGARRLGVTPYAAECEFMGTDGLVFALGFHRGDDIAHYLASGYDVVAVEADPALCEQGWARFAKAIDEHRLTLIHAAVVGQERRLQQTSIACHPPSGKTVRDTVRAGCSQGINEGSALAHDPTLEIATISLEELVGRHGCPIFLAVDTEGMNAEVIEDLERLAHLPNFVSWEIGEGTLWAVVGTHLKMSSFGYKRFRIVHQMDNHEQSSGTLPAIEPDSSEPMPAHHGSPWRSLSYVLRECVFLFLVYRLFGSRSLFARAERHPTAVIHALPRRFRMWMQRHHIPSPGRYYSHASRCL